jgi:hypothetical protein
MPGEDLQRVGAGVTIEFERDHRLEVVKKRHRVRV